jgi:hypothetical protein
MLWKFKEDGAVVEERGGGHERPSKEDDALGAGGKRPWAELPAENRLLYSGLCVQPKLWSAECQDLKRWDTDGIQTCIPSHTWGTDEQ